MMGESLLDIIKNYYIKKIEKIYYRSKKKQLADKAIYFILPIELYSILDNPSEVYNKLFDLIVNKKQYDILFPFLKEFIFPYDLEEKKEYYTELLINISFKFKQLELEKKSFTINDKIFIIIKTNITFDEYEKLPNELKNIVYDLTYINNNTDKNKSIK